MSREIGKQISFAAPADIYERVKAQAGAGHRTISQEMRLILIEYFEEKNDCSRLE